MRCTPACACVVFAHTRLSLFRLCLADQSIDEQACRLRRTCLLHACTLPICDDLLRDPSALLVWILAAGVPDFCYARTLASYGSTSYLSVSVYCIRSPFPNSKEYSKNTGIENSKFERRFLKCLLGDSRLFALSYRGNV